MQMPAESSVEYKYLKQAWRVQPCLSVFNAPHKFIVKIPGLKEVMEPPVEPQMAFAQQMLLELIDSGFTVDMLAKRLKTPLKTLSKVVFGNTQSPSHRLFKQILTMYCALIISGGCDVKPA